MLNPLDPVAEIGAIEQALDHYKQTHPRAEIAVKRQNSGSIRIRIIDPDFSRLDKAQRHDLIWELLDPLSEDVLSQITVLLLMTPEESKTSFANMDFENPIPSQL